MSALVDINNKTFGRLSVLGLSSIRNRSGRAMWWCICECGTLQRLS